jgi:hypothetical protein
MQSLKTPPRHRNITVRRLVWDACQFVRSQSFVSKRFGKPFHPSRKYAEIDITYKCNLKCTNCNRSCTQAPSQTEMPLSMVEGFLQQSVDKQVAWKRIRILGGEPTLHSRIFDIIDLLINYQRVYNPSVKLVLGTNLHGARVHRVLEKLPDAIFLKSTLKSSRVNLFRPMNMAPTDSVLNCYADYTCGCRIIEECGLGVTPSGYYMCAVAGGIDRIFGYRLGRSTLPDDRERFSDQMNAFCRLCGHFGFQWPTRKEKISETWRLAYQRLKTKERSANSSEEQSSIYGSTR